MEANRKKLGPNCLGATGMSTGTPATCPARHEVVDENETDATHGACRSEAGSPKISKCYAEAAEQIAGTIVSR